MHYIHPSQTCGDYTIIQLYIFQLIATSITTSNGPFYLHSFYCFIQFMMMFDICLFNKFDFMFQSRRKRPRTPTPGHYLGLKNSRDGGKFLFIVNVGCYVIRSFGV